MDKNIIIPKFIEMFDEHPWDIYLTPQELSAFLESIEFHIDWKKTIQKNLIIKEIL